MKFKKEREERKRRKGKVGINHISISKFFKASFLFFFFSSKQYHHVKYTSSINKTPGIIVAFPSSRHSATF